MTQCRNEKPSQCERQSFQLLRTENEKLRFEKSNKSDPAEVCNASRIGFNKHANLISLPTKWKKTSKVTSGKKKNNDKKNKTQNRQKGMQLLLAAYMKESVRTLAGNSAVVYGCNIDFIQPRGKGNYVLNYKDVSVTCQLRELYWPCGGCGCFATGDTGKLRAPKCSSAETADLQFAESAPK